MYYGSIKRKEINNNLKKYIHIMETNEIEKQINEFINDTYERIEEKLEECTNNIEINCSNVRRWIKENVEKNGAFYWNIFLQNTTLKVSKFLVKRNRKFLTCYVSGTSIRVTPSNYVNF